MTLSAKITAFKINNLKLLFQIVTSINDTPVKKVNRTLEDFEKIGLEANLPTERVSISEQVAIFHEFQ